MLIQKNSKTIQVAIFTFIVFPSMYFLSVFVLREISTQTVRKWHVPNSVKPIQSVAMSFSVNL